MSEPVAILLAVLIATSPVTIIIGYGLWRNWWRR